MADEPGRRTLGFSVTPAPVTVVTDLGATVTLVDSGDIILDGFYTRVGIGEDGRYYPIVVNESVSGAAIGSDWVFDTGGNPNSIGMDYVKIIDGDNNYVNPSLLPWLVQFGASFPLTFNSCYMVTNGGSKIVGFESIICQQGNRMALDPTINGHRWHLTTIDGEYEVNCNGDGFTTIAVGEYTFKCTNDNSIWNYFCNYNFIKALGANTSIFES